MKQTGKARSGRWFAFKNGLILTLWAIGTGMWSGSALSG